MLSPIARVICAASNERVPDAKFMISGLIGPKSNAHGPNEFLHVPTGKKPTAAVADVIAKCYERAGETV